MKNDFQDAINDIDSFINDLTADVDADDLESDAEYVKSDYDTLQQLCNTLLAPVPTAVVSQSPDGHGGGGEVRLSLATSTRFNRGLHGLG